MFPSNPCFVLALLAVSFFGNFLVSVDGKCAIEPDDVGHVDWRSKKKTIGKNAFKNCKELVTISIPPGVKSIDNTAFVKSGLDLTELQKCDCDTPAPPLYCPAPPLYYFKGPGKLAPQAEGEGVLLTAPPTDYTLQFTINLKSISQDWTNIITLTDRGEAAPDYRYGSRVPSVFFYPKTTQIYAFPQVNDMLEPPQHPGIYSEPLELNKNYAVIIKVVGATATISINSIIQYTRTVGPRSPLNYVYFYVGEPWSKSADAVISEITYG